MSDDIFINDNPEKELARLERTNFFRDKPADQAKSAYLYYLAKREAKRWGVHDNLADRYARLAAHARRLGV